MSQRYQASISTSTTQKSALTLSEGGTSSLRSIPSSSTRALLYQILHDALRDTPMKLQPMATMCQEQVTTVVPLTCFAHVGLLITDLFRIKLVIEPTLISSDLSPIYRSRTLKRHLRTRIVETGGMQERTEPILVNTSSQTRARIHTAKRDSIATEEKCNN